MDPPYDTKLFDELCNEISSDVSFGSEDWLEGICQESPTIKDELCTKHDNNINLSPSDYFASTEDVHIHSISKNYNDNADVDDCDDDEDDDVNIKEHRRKRSRNCPDAEIIAQATENNLKLLNIDPNSKEGKKQRRKIRNRMSAQMHRERKAKYIEVLERMVNERDAKILDLQNSLHRVKLDNERLKGQLYILAPELDHTIGNESFEEGTLPVLSMLQSKHKTDRDHLDPNPDPDPDHDTTSVSASVSISPPSSDHYESDTSSLEPPSHTNSPPHVSSFYRTGVSVFSLLMMLGVTFLSNDIPLTDITSLSVPSTSSQHFLPQLPYFHIQLDSELYESQYLSPSLELSSLNQASHTQAYQHEDRERSRERSGRVLLESSLPSPTVSSSAHPQHSYRLPRMPLQSSVSKTSTALWRYQDPVAQLFPISPPQHGTRDSSEESSSPMSRRGARQNLRTRKKGSSQSVSSDSDMDRDSETEAHAGKALVVASPAITWSNSAEETEALVRRVGASRVLMTQGRALLDHHLLPDPVNLSAHIQADTSDVETVSRALTNKLSSHWSEPRETAASSKLTVPSVITTNYLDFTPQPQSKADFHHSAAASPVLMMLVPASAVRWGNSWEDATQDPFADFMGSKTRFSEDEKSTKSDSEYDETSPLWVEIGCSVFRAQLVRNVTLA
mmetsp:Transcript_27852/g.28106  ORF Transcript_27852/g.28106 Transcript_27852/m.28106 type:complete len:675 (-) Transcript_27852:38-2062(-)